MSRTLVCIGIGCIVAGLLWPWLRTFPLGRLPGDMVIVREHFRLYLPLTSSILASLVVSILFWFLHK